jgi:ribosomal protein S18 acetylase RimI-like enzyme
MQGKTLTTVEISKGSPLPADVKQVLDEASRTISLLDDDTRALRQKAMDTALSGVCDLIVIMAGDSPAGLVCCDAAGDDVQLPFGYVLGTYRGRRAEAFMKTVSILEKRFRTIRSNFNWPEPEAFSAAARAMSFTVVERLGMARDTDPGHEVRPLPEGFEIRPFSREYFDETARLMCDTSDPMDRVVYPFFTSVEGCRTHLGNYLSSVYGSYQPGLSYAACRGDRLAGYLMTVSFYEGIARIIDVAVDGAFRGRGLASAMIDRLVRDSGLAGFRTIELAVTASNRDALQLYLHKGFTVKETFRQHVYVSGAENKI